MNNKCIAWAQAYERKSNMCIVPLYFVTSPQLFNHIYINFIIFKTLFLVIKKTIVSIIQTYRPSTPWRTSGRTVNKKIWRESEAYRNFSKRFDWSLAIKRHIVMAAPIAVTAPSSVQNLKKSSSRRFDGKSMSLDDRDYKSIKNLTENTTDAWFTQT